MSFFLTTHPSSVATRFEKPRVDERSQSGIPGTRKFGVAGWRGTMNFAPQRASSRLLGELERADALDGSFYADLYSRGDPPEAAVWLAADTMTPTGFRIAKTLSAGFGVGRVVSIRSSMGPAMVTARMIEDRTEPAQHTYYYAFGTPLPREFVPTRPGVTFQVCFNRPHVRARIRSDSIEWATSNREMRPLAIEWFEDSRTMVTSLFAAARSPVPPGELPIQNRFLITEDGRYLTTEDGRFLITEN